MVRRQRIKTILESHDDGAQVAVCGWVRSKRVSKKFAFLVISDGSCQGVLQIVIDAGTEAFEQLDNCQTGAAVRIEGQLVASPGQGQAVEVRGQNLKVVGPADSASYPLQKKGHSLEFLREIAHLRPRTNTFGAVFRIRNLLARATHGFFQSEGFLWAHTPIITAIDAEGAGELFQVTQIDLEKPPKTATGAIDWHQDFFGRKSFLTVSGQLQGEYLAQALGDIYTFGPTFRAENSQTSRHLAEFWMVEPEMAFADLEDNIALAEAYLKHLFREVLHHCRDELAFLEKQYEAMKVVDLEKLVTAPLTKITYTEAVTTLQQSGHKFEFPVAWGSDLQSEHEKYLTDKVFGGLVAVTDYPRDIKAFYMRQNDDGKTVAAVDVLAPRIGEIIGGSQREERLTELEARMGDLSIPRDDLEWFLDLRRYGTAPHAGFGLGFDRLVQYVTGMGNIRDVIPSPRAVNLASF